MAKVELTNEDYKKRYGISKEEYLKREKEVKQIDRNRPKTTLEYDFGKDSELVWPKNYIQ